MEENPPKPDSADEAGPPRTDDASSTNLKHVLIKWTGSKRRQAKQIVAQFPRRIATYYEPFLGGGSVLYELLGTDIEVGRFECSDICEPLIALWQVVKDDPGGLVEEYGKNWRMLGLHGALYYREMRREFNLSNDPHLFFFLLRTCRAGHVRFNRAGEFYGSFHQANLGMAPERVQALAQNWHRRLASKNVSFSVRDYRRITTTEGDLLYLDPPYETGEGRHYSGKIDFGELFGWLRKQQGDHLLSLNGFVGDENRMLDVPTDLYDRHRLLDNGDDPFDRLEGRTPRLVMESLYIKRRFPVQVATSAPLLPEPDTKAPKKDSKSAEIRSLLEMEPDLSGPQVVRRLAERSIDVDANLVRVVRHNVRKASGWLDRCEIEKQESLVQRVLGRLSLMITRYIEAGNPSAEHVRLTRDELMPMVRILGGEVQEDELLYVARAIWLVRYTRARNLGLDVASAEIDRILSRMDHFRGDSEETSGIKSTNLRNLPEATNHPKLTERARSSNLLQLSGRTGSQSWSRS